MRVLCDIGECLCDDEIGGRLDPIGQTLTGRRLELDGKRGTVRQAVERCIEAAVGEHGWMNAARKLAQLG
jgi:hypothetical protein